MKIRFEKNFIKKMKKSVDMKFCFGYNIFRR